MYASTLKNGIYYITKDKKPLLTPMGHAVSTTYSKLAARIVEDLTKYGEDPANPVSVVAFHYPLIDFSLHMPREQNEHSVAIGLDEEHDWTSKCPSAAPDAMMKWWGVFGLAMSEKSRDEAKHWLSSLTLMQLCAVCVIGRLIESVNIPYRLATVIKPNETRSFAAAIVEFYPYISAEELANAFATFRFYFNVEA